MAPNLMTKLTEKFESAMKKKIEPITDSKM